MSLLSGTGISVRKQDSVLLDDVSLDIDNGELVGLVGPNGAGKSTLMGTLAGLNRIDAGNITLAGKALHKISAHERGRLLAWVEQSGPVEWPLSVERVVMLGRRPHLGAWQQAGDIDVEVVMQALRITDCEHLKERDVTTLSGGERTRVLLARALATEARVLLADEPVAALDLGHQLQTMDLLRQFSTGQQCCLVVLHDLSLAARYCDRVYMMCEAKIVAHGIPQKVLVPQVISSVYGVEVATGVTRVRHDDSREIQSLDVPWIVPVKRTGRS